MAYRYTDKYQRMVINLETGEMIQGGHIRKLIADGNTIEPPVPSQSDVIVERERRLAAGFDYDFQDSRGVHHIGTTEADLKGWDEVTKAAQAAINLGDSLANLYIVTDTGPVSLTASEWQMILATAAAVRQPIWLKSFEIAMMNPIPADFTDDSYWT